MNSAQRRRAFRLGYANGVLWAIGNALTTGTLVTYLALELGAAGLGLSLILAVPSVIGLLRFLTPALIRWFGAAKHAAVACFVLSYVLIWGLPAAGVSSVVPRRVALPFLIVLVSAHQLLEYMGQVALWDWLADIVPRQIRGRYFGRRQMLQLAVVIPTLLLSGKFSDDWRSTYGQSNSDMALLAFAIPNAVGAVFLLSSIVPLCLMPATRCARTSQHHPALLFVALADGRFRRLLLYGCWFSFFNGITQAAQNIFPRQVLGLGVQTMAAMRISMQAGQIGVSAWAGPFSDRFGNRPVMILSQGALALAPLFFLMAAKTEPGWLFGVYIAWAAYAGINLCLPNLMLKLAEHGAGATYIATYFAVTNVFYGASTVLGGVVFDQLGTARATAALAVYGLDRYTAAFTIALVARAFAIVLLVRLIEPGARAWSWILWKRSSV